MDRPDELLEQLRNPTKTLRRAIPGTWAGFVSTHESAMAEGEVPTRLKEAVALAISVACQCDGCIAHHARAAARAGATPGEIAEILGVALLMGGGTAAVYAPLAWDAYQHYAAEVAPTGGG